MNDNKLNRYGLAYSFTLMLLKSALDNQNAGLAAMTDKSFFVFMAEKMNLILDGFSWDDFKIEIDQLDENHPVIFYIFPEPRVEPEAKFGALVLDKTDNMVSYYTLELGLSKDIWGVVLNTPDGRDLIGLYNIWPSKKNFFNIIKGAAQFYFSGNVKTVLTLPKEYQELNRTEDDPKYAVSYGMQTESCSAFVQAYPITLSSAMDFGNDRKVIDRIHQSLEDNQALIEVKSGRTHNGFRFMYSIIKTLMQPSGGVQYFALFQIHYGSNLALNVKAFFTECGDTGERDATMWNVMVERGVVSIEDNSRWSFDPYDEDFKRPYLMNLSERAGYDCLFPKHPLSECRNLINYMIAKTL